MSILGDEQMQMTRQFIFQNGRLLERQLFEFFFGKGTKQACVQALLAYQNADGGFGNGVEPDLLCPDSTAIGAETAMFVMELLDYREPAVVGPLLVWITDHQNEVGYIPHPPPNLFDYPYQPWWKNPDPDRVLALAGFLGKWGVEHDAFFRKARGYYEQAEAPSADNYYGYPYFAYLKYLSENALDRARLAAMVEQLPALLATHADHFPLFTRAWFHAADFVAREVVETEAQAFAAAIQEDGGLAAPYPDLPWWRPLWTLDGLILLKRLSFL
jgi:hypothetical protein